MGIPSDKEQCGSPVGGLVGCGGQDGKDHGAGRPRHSTWGEHLPVIGRKFAAQREMDQSLVGQIGRIIRKLWKNLPCRMVMGAALAVVLGVGAGHIFIGSVYVVEGTSMAPTYSPGTHLYGAPISTPLERGTLYCLTTGKRSMRSSGS